MSGSAVALTNSSMTTNEGSSCMSDTCGELLFYTDGDSVFNRNHQVMSNGTGLLGCNSSTQSALIVPQPQNDSLYYLFTTDCWENNGSNGLRYSIINIKLNGGLGGVTSKNNLLIAPSAEKLAASFHTNGKDIWIIGRKSNSADFCAYLLSNTGLNTIPVITTLGSKAINGGGGFMHFSPNGNKVSAAHWDFDVSNQSDTIDLFDFNKGTGGLSNLITIKVDSQFNVYGTAFSPDNSKLYVTAIKFIPSVTGRIYQYDITSNIQSVIMSSRKTISSLDSTYYYGIANGPDGKMYITITGFTVQSGDSLGIINSPNSSGSSCGFKKNGLYLNGRKAVFGLPTFVDSYFSQPWTLPCPNGLRDLKVEPNDLSFYPNPFSSTTKLCLDSRFLNQKISLFIFNSQGREVAKNNFVYVSPLDIVLDALTPGVYFVKVICNTESLYKKLIHTN